MSNSVTLDFAGMDELANDIAKMASNDLQEIEKESLQAGAEIVRRQQQANWNRSHNQGEHIQDSINVGRVYGIETGSKVNIAPKMSLRWRAKFVEDGTSYQVAQSPIERSLTMTQAQVANTMFEVMSRVFDG